MKKVIVSMTTLFLAVALAGGLGWAADQDRIMDQDRLSDRDMYGWEMMTREERNEHRERIRSFNNEREREQYRLEHHNRMQERAKKQGRSLPDMPAERGKGMGPGGGGRR